MNTIHQLCICTVLFLATFAINRAEAHVGECAKKEGMEQLRCERHEEMAKKCGPVKGEAHFICDREFLLANPIGCKALTGKVLSACAAEQKAFKTCEPNMSREFMKCVIKSTGESPMGH